MRLALLPLAAALLACAPTAGLVRDDSADVTRCTTDLECNPGDECIRPRGELGRAAGLETSFTLRPS